MRPGNPAPDEYGSAELTCDIVMKGGITSGVVYPAAVLEIARTYRFKSIGGTSAGGIAAAVTAAAEHARDQGGFEKIKTLPDELGSTVGGRPFMLQLFTPDPATKPLFSTLVGFLRGPAAGMGSLVRAFWRFPALAAVVAAIALELSFAGTVDATVGVAGIAIAVVILIAGIAYDVVAAVKRLAENDYGLCRLGPDAGTNAAPALTGWLHKRIQDTAGRLPVDRPLTFADLWGVPEPASEGDPPGDLSRIDALRELSRNPRDRAVDLQMMTTDVTHGRPMRLPVPLQPYADRLEEGGGLFFDPGELGRFFPAAVIEHVVRCGRPPSRSTAEKIARSEVRGAGAVRRAQLRHFPVGPDLPVVVATRMSLSFPLLISAVPLYELDLTKGDAHPVLRRAWFSDGGITSNFPIHFFDAPLPTRPTFGLDLTGFPEGQGPVAGDPRASVTDPAAINGPAPATVAEFGSVLGFVTAIKDAAQNWRDNAQAQLPGFRERIIHIKLAAGEGGLNLTMDAGKIHELTERGQFAGRRLVELFSAPTPAEDRWNDYRFVRYRVAMSTIERLLRGYASGYSAPVVPGTTSYDERIRRGQDAPPYAFGSAARREFAEATTKAYLELVSGWQGAKTLDDPNVPRPPSTLRQVPPV